VTYVAFSPAVTFTRALVTHTNTSQRHCFTEAGDCLSIHRDIQHTHTSPNTGLTLFFFNRSAFFVIEIQNFKEQEKKLCMYCKGTGYLQCAECCTSDRPGRLIDPVSGAKCFCGTCSGTAKVMCSSCLATGREIVTEHDRRIDPFD
jgi:hypothetical protein